LDTGVAREVEFVSLHRVTDVGRELHFTEDSPRREGLLANDHPIGESIPRLERRLWLRLGIVEADEPRAAVGGAVDVDHGASVPLKRGGAGDRGTVLGAAQAREKPSVEEL